MPFPVIRGSVLLLVLLGWVVPRQFRQKGLWVQLPTIPGWGLLLALAGWPVPRRTCWKAVLVLVPAIPGPGLLLAVDGWVVSRQSWWRALWVCCWLRWGWCSFVITSGVPFGCSYQPFLAWARCCLWLSGCSLPNPGVFPCWGLVQSAVGSMIPLESWRRAFWVQFPAFPGEGLPLALAEWVVPHHFWLRALWMQFPAIPGWGLLLVVVG